MAVFLLHIKKEKKMNTREIKFEEKNFILTIRNDSPVVITVPHDGTLPKQYLRGMFAERTQDVDRDIRIGRDKHVFPIVKDISLNARVNVVYAMVHRAYIDFNRPPEIGVEDKNLIDVYNYYHTTVTKLVSWCKNKYGYCLLLDLHGCANLTKPGMENVDIILGTNNRKSVFSNIDIKLEQWLIDHEYAVLVADDEIFQGIFTGRYNVIDYAERFHVDSILIEITSRYRVKGAESLGMILANDIAEFIRVYINQR